MLLRSETINTGREIADGLQFPGALGKTDVELVFELEYHFDHGERIDRELVHTRRRVNELRRDFELLRENLPQAFERCVCFHAQLASSSDANLPNGGTPREVGTMRALPAPRAITVISRGARSMNGQTIGASQGLIARCARVAARCRRGANAWPPRPADSAATRGTGA